MTFSSHQTRLVGRSDAIRKVDEDIDLAARSDAKVLITGETGVGKEVVARLIHQRSSRSSARLVTLNCAGVPDSLLESEFFGHTRGSFTGAYRDKPGLLEGAPNGTVFLDEIGEMSTRLQAMLLRFLESGEIQRIGADRPHARVNVRLIAATNRELQEQINAGAFREDLYFRLNVVRLEIPPLRERSEDVPLLIQHFLESYSRLHKVSANTVQPDAMDALVAYRWPGNVRELKNVVERMVLKAEGDEITRKDLPAEVFRSAPGRAAQTPGARGRDDVAVQMTQAEELTAMMLTHGESFWSAVYPLFMARDMTRADLRKIIEFGLEQTNGNYRLLVQMFNMPREDYKRFLSFLRKHDCHLPFQRFRVVPARYREDRDAPAKTHAHAQ